MKVPARIAVLTEAGFVTAAYGSSDEAKLVQRLHMKRVRT